MKTLQRLLFATIAGISFWSSLSITRADPLALWHSRNSGATNILNADACGNGICVAVGNQGTILSSADGLVWTRRNSGTTAVLNSMVWANSLFVIVGESGTILTSTNGTNWTRRTSGTTNFLYDVSYGKGIFIAVSDSGTVLTSTNGVAWTLRSGGTQGVYGVAYGNGTFVAVGGVTVCFFICFNNSVASTSGDAVTWTPSNPGPNVFLSDLAFGNGTFVAVGEGGTILTSTNGVNWTPQNSGSTDFLLNVAFGDDTFVVVGAQQGSILTSTNGVNWTKRNSGTSNGLFNVAYGSGTFVVVGNSGTILQSRYIGPAILHRPRFLTDGSVEIPIVGKVEQNYRLQVSTNLATPRWTDLEAFTQTNETQNVVDSEAANFSSRFYRVVRSP
jgi:hypothetical protein